MEHQALKRKTDLHLARKIWHCLGILVMAVGYNFAGHEGAWFILIGAIAVVVPLDLLRHSRPGLNRALVKVFGPVMRNHEMNAVSGWTYLLLGALILILFDDLHIITLTLLFQAFGDPMASYFGIRFGKDKLIGNKSLQGTMAAFAVCTVIAAIYFYANNLMLERFLIVAPLAGLIGALAEVAPVGRLDDNLTFPVICALLLKVLFVVYGTTML
jgi:diacylglycerol kinase (CTP)